MNGVLVSWVVYFMGMAFLKYCLSYLTKPFIDWIIKYIGENTPDNTSG